MNKKNHSRTWTYQNDIETKPQALIDPVKYFRETRKLTELNIQKAIEMNASHLLYAFHDWCRWAPFRDGKDHSFEEWHKDIKKKNE